MTTQTPRRGFEAASHERRRFWMLWLVGSAVVVVIAALSWWLVLGDDDTPTASFDGQSATYDGPTTFDAGEVTFTFDARDHQPGAAFVFTELRDDSLTFDDLERWGAENSAGVVPPWVGELDITIVDDDDRVVDKTFELTSGARYSIWVNTAPDDTDTAHPVVILEVE